MFKRKSVEHKQTLNGVWSVQSCNTRTNKYLAGVGGLLSSTRRWHAGYRRLTTRDPLLHVMLCFHLVRPGFLKLSDSSLEFLPFGEICGCHLCLCGSCIPNYCSTLFQSVLVLLCRHAQTSALDSVFVAYQVGKWLQCLQKSWWDEPFEQVIMTSLSFNIKDGHRSQKAFSER